LSGPSAVKSTKQLIQHVTEKCNSIPETKDYVCNLIADLRVSDEGQEGLDSFFGKRKPNWINNTKS